MAQQVSTVITSDLSGKEGASTYSFGLDGLNYEIDLLDSEYETFTAELAKWVEAGRKVSSTPRRKSSRRRNA